MRLHSFYSVVRANSKLAQFRVRTIHKKKGALPDLLVNCAATLSLYVEYQ